MFFILGKVRDILTGFEDKENKEATDTIQKVISRYGYALEFLDLEKQMGAVVSSNTNILFSDGRVKIESVSKIVDENGEPLPVFHVTGAQLGCRSPISLINCIINKNDIELNWFIDFFNNLSL